MAAEYWSLEYPAGTERTFASWGFTEPRLSIRNQEMSVFQVTVPGATSLASAPPIPFEAKVVVRRYPDGVTAQVVFRGRQITDRRRASQSPARTLSFGDAWYDLNNIPFQQNWTYTHDGVTMLGQPFTRLILFQDGATGNLITNGTQIKAIIDWAAGCGANIQCGASVLANMTWYLPVYPCRGLMCSAALDLCFRPTPDVGVWIDHTTNPPTFNCGQRPALAALSLAYADNGATHRESEITARYDLVAPQVVLQYQKTLTVNDQTFNDFGTDVYPPGSTGQALRALVVPLDLRGYQRTDLVEKLTSAAIDPSTLAWWKGKKQELKAASILALALVSYKILDETGTDITATILGTLPNELTKGEVLSWMKTGTGDPVVAQQVTIQGKFTYDEYDPSNRKHHVVGANNPHVISVRVKLTNSALGDQYYRITESLDVGETAPAGLAQAIYNMLQPVPYEGHHSLSEKNASGFAQVTTIIDPRYVLNLTGGDAAWATMRATIQSVEVDFFKGATEITIGPPKHIAPGDLAEILQFFRLRLKYDNLNLRVTGNVGSQSAEIGGDTAGENTTQGNPPPQLHTTAAPAAGGNTTWVQHDAVGQAIMLQVVNPAGAVQDAAGKVIMSLAATEGRAVYLQWFYFKNSADACKLYRMLVLASVPELAP